MDKEIEDRKERMQRIRVGLTGLAVVLLLVLLATAIFSRVNGGAPSVQSTDKSGDEPLSDLGIVPRAPDNSTTPANTTVPNAPAPR